MILSSEFSTIHSFINVKISLLSDIITINCSYLNESIGENIFTNVRISVNFPNSDGVKSLVVIGAAAIDTNCAIKDPEANNEIDFKKELSFLK